MQIVPRSWFSWDFSVLLNGSCVAEIDISAWREKGLLSVAGATYNVYREGWMSGAFILELDGAQLACAEKPSALLRSFTVWHTGKTYTLKAESPFGRTFVLLENDRQVGSITPQGVFTRKAIVDLPEELPLPVKVFLIWLTVILWKRAANAAAASAAGS